MSALSTTAPGPWVAGDDLFVRDANGLVLFDAGYRGRTGNAPAIAAIAAAAPALVLALLACVEHMEHSTPQGKAAHDAAWTMLAQLLGGAA